MRSKSIFIKHKNQHIKIAFEAVLWLQSEGNHCEIHTDDNKYFVQFSLSSLIEKFPSDQFVQIHASFGVNSQRMTSVDLLNDKVLIENKELPLGQAYKKKLIERLNCI